MRRYNWETLSYTYPNYKTNDLIKVMIRMRSTSGTIPLFLPIIEYLFWPLIRGTSPFRYKRKYHETSNNFLFYKSLKILQLRCQTVLGSIIHFGKISKLKKGVILRKNIVSKFPVDMHIYTLCPSLLHYYKVSRVWNNFLWICTSTWYVFLNYKVSRNSVEQFHKSCAYKLFLLYLSICPNF